MSKSILALALIFVSGVVHADVITCHQTEPFITEVFDLENDTLTISTPEDKRIEKGLKFILTGVNKFEIVSKSTGKIIRRFTIDYKANDGMSEMIYPISGGKGVNGEAACFSSKLDRLQMIHN